MASPNLNMYFTGDSNRREFASGANFNGTPNIAGANGDSFEQNVSPRIQPQTSPPPNVARDNVIDPIAFLPLAASRSGTSNISPSMQASEIYARQLFTIGNGYPLWSPKTNNRGYPPIYKKNGVQIGDVGILTEKGGFDYMFNICHDEGHELNLNRVPNGFEPLTISEPNYRENDVADETYTRDYVVSHPDEIYDGKVGPKLGEFDAGLSFTSAATRGALLILPEGGKGEDHRQLKLFKSYIAKHARSWFEYVFDGPGGRGGDRGDGIYDDPLYLVTGCDKARAWGVACFDNAELEREVHLEFVWSENESGPGLRKYGFYPHNSAKRSSGADDEFKNQSGCAFLRGYRIARRDSGRSPEISSGVTSNYISQLDADIVVPTHQKLKPTPTYPQKALSWFQAMLGGLSSYTVYHPSDVINKMILYNNPQVDIAVTHDDDWASVIQEDDKGMPEDQELIRRVCNFPLEYIDTDGHTACIRVASTFMVKRDEKRHGNALQVASVHGDEAIGKLLLDQGADVNAQGGQYGNALQAASAEGHETIVKLLLDHGADINLPGREKQTPLIGASALRWASQKNHSQIVENLIDHGADINLPGSGKQTPGFSGFGGGSHIQSSTSYPQDGYLSYFMGSETTYDSADQTPDLTSSSLSGNSLESLSDTLRARQERHDRMREDIRRMNNIPSNVPVNLNALPDPPAGQSPTQPLATLVQLAIAGSPEFKLTQRGIREAITQRFPFYRESTKWHGSVRHMLSVKGQFIQVERPITAPGQGGYWTLDTTVTGDKRTRKRRLRRLTQWVTDTEDESEPPVSPVAAQESTTTLRVGSNTTTSAIAASTSGAATAMVPPGHRGGRPVADPARYRPRRTESDANLPLNIESMSIGTGQAAAASYSVPYIEPPPAQAPYRGTWSAHHQHHTRPSYAPYHHSTSYIPHSSFASYSHRAEAPRPSFTMPPMPDFAPVMSAPTHDVLGSPPQAEPQASSSSSSLPGVGTGPVRIITEPH